MSKQNRFLRKQGLLLIHGNVHTRTRFTHVYEANSGVYVGGVQSKMAILQTAPLRKLIFTKLRVRTKRFLARLSRVG